MTNKINEQAAHNAVLRWCRKQEQGICMRELPDPQPGARVAVLNVNHTELVPGEVNRYRTVRVAEGDTWLDVYKKLRICLKCATFAHVLDEQHQCIECQITGRSG